MRVSIIAAVALACGLSSLGCGALPKGQKGLLGDVQKTADALKKGDVDKAATTVKKSEATKTAEGAVKKETGADKGDKADKENAAKEGNSPKVDGKKVEAAKTDGKTDGKAEAARADGGSKPDASKLAADKKDEGTADAPKPGAKRAPPTKKTPPVTPK